jgi:mannose-1-phosphate guanylyltransferase
MKAIVLAAGFGTRLRPLTNTIPKCLVPVGGQPLLGHWLDKLRRLGVASALVNTHYLADQVHQFLDSWEAAEADPGTAGEEAMSIAVSHEPSLLGTAGTLLGNIGFFLTPPWSGTGLLIHADNFTQDGLHGLINAHRNRDPDCLLTMLTFTTDNPSQCGIVECDERGVVTSFHEKVQDPPGRRANGAVYVFGQEFLSWLTETHPSAQDFSTEVLPFCVHRIQTWHTDQPYIDIGTPEALSAARALYNSGVTPIPAQDSHPQSDMQP